MSKYALKLHEVKNVTFLNNVAEKNTILPGWIPGYKHDYLQPLPLNTAKKESNLKQRGGRDDDDVQIDSVHSHSKQVYTYMCTCT